ncbi:MAG: RnfABCDGE type electron transport complex subunit B [Candidatus Omnitrophota bacterium]|nr:RnfABCDGE type electron transport complex subunit B [Candidatus Omnitrophota bacterium]
MDDLMLVSVLSMAGMAIIFASVLAFADKKLRVQEDPRISVVFKLLPHVNCGACGYVNCHDFAEHLIKEGDDPVKCRVLGEEAREKLCQMLGKEAGPRWPKIPLVHCAAEWENKEPVAEYKGVRTCRAADLAFGGGMRCEYGCMGFGDCVEVCPFGALRMENGLPRLDQGKCTGCGKCVEVCPRNIISLREKRHEKIFYVACNSHDGALRVRQICGAGCIACGICEKLSPEKLFIVADNLSRADFSKQEDQGKVRNIAGKCPTKVIKEI